MSEHIAAVLLAAGQGTRMQSDKPKVMHAIAGRPMIQHLLATLDGLAVTRRVVVIGPEMDNVAAAVAPHATVIQQERLGTAHAVLQARGPLAGFAGTVLVLYGDTPLITGETLRAMVKAREQASVVVLGFRPQDPAAYGRLVVENGALTSIVEYKDASPEQRAIGLCNSGVMAIDGAKLFDLLDKIGNDNAKGEYYLTDIVALAVAQGLAARHVEADADEVMGVNSRMELAMAEKIVQQRLRARAMEKGATLIDPDSVFFCWDSEIGRDVTIGPNVVFGPKVQIEDGVEIRAFSHFEGVIIRKGAQVGPFARLRPGAVIGENAHVGNFVEVKNAKIEEGAKVNHLSYIGDARIGAKANIGAGTITCNYDGFGKYHTDIGAGAFIGSNSALVAPVTIGDGAIVGAGSVITKNVEKDALAVARGSQMALPGWAARFRANSVKDKK